MRAVPSEVSHHRHPNCETPQCPGSKERRNVDAACEEVADAATPSAVSTPDGTPVYRTADFVFTR